MLTGTALNRDDLSGWVRAIYQYLMLDREATVDDVAQSFDEHLVSDKWFPRIADLVPLVEKRVLARQEVSRRATAQREAVAAPELESGAVDYSAWYTRDLPPGYDYAEDPHWQAGIDLMASAVKAKGDLGPMGNMVRDLAQRMERHEPVGFQGASKEREVVCPACKGARYVRLGGWDGHPEQIGEPGSKYVMCKVCCPYGTYSEQAEREAARKAAR